MKPIRAVGHARYYVEAAQKLGYQVTPILEPHIFTISHQSRELRLVKSAPDINTAAGAKISKNKHLTAHFLAQYGFPVPQQQLVTTRTTVEELKKILGTSLVLKPKDLSCGVDVFVQLQDPEEIATTLSYLRQKYTSCLAENFVSGTDYRALMYRGKLIGLVKREPPYIVGDGKSSVADLVVPLKRFKQDAHYSAMKRQLGITDTTIIEKSRKVVLRQNSNGSTGGFSTTLEQNHLHPDLVTLLQEAVSAIGLTLAGIDILIKDVTKPRTNNAVIIEINSTPGLHIHYRPTFGPVQDVAATILQDRLGSDDKSR